MLATDALGAPGKITTKGTVTIYTPSAAASQAISLADIASARAMPMPTVTSPPPGGTEGGLAPKSQAASGFSPGARGDGKTSPVKLPVGGTLDADEIIPQAGSGVAPMEYGAALQPYTTMRVDLVNNNESKAWPYRAAGTLYFQDSGYTWACSASLIKRGLVVTAAHCVAAFGEYRFYSNWQFVPARSNATAPFGIWTVANAMVLTTYYNGTDSCAESGIVCKNDVAVLRLTAKSGAYPGTNTGWFGYGWNGYGFTVNNLALINQLGYPVSHDGGLKMQRTDSQGYVSWGYSNNTVWGSRQDGGASGGPELVNLGILPALTTPIGADGAANTVVGVTSWGYTDSSIKLLGASPFTSDNIVPLVATACSGQAACQ